MKRRAFIAGLGATAILSRAGRATAQGASPPIVGFLSLASREGHTLDLEGFRRGLSRHGYIEGSTILIEERYADGHVERLSEFINQFVKQEVSLVLCPGPSAARLVRRLAPTMRVVAVALPSSNNYPDLFSTLARPGGMITGFSHIGPDLARKRIGLLKDIVPGLRAVAVMYSLTDPLYREWGADAEKAAQSLGFEAVQLGLTSPEVSELTQQMASAKAAGATGMLVIRDFITESLREDIFRAATEARIATLAEHRNYAEKGALISYGASLPDLFRRAANYVDRILKGENPADLPIQLPTKFELIVNLRTAKNLGLDIQPSLLARADEVIE